MFPKPFQTGDVVWAPDPYHANDPELLQAQKRPWMVVSTQAYPAQGQDYICCAMTSNMAPSDGCIPVQPTEWELGPGVPKPSQIDSQTILTVKHAWISKYSGRIAFAKVSRARKLLQDYVSMAR